MLVPLRVRDDLPKVVITSPDMINPATISEKLTNIKYPERYTECKWEPLHMKELRDIKEAIVSYGIHSACLRQ